LGHGLGQPAGRLRRAVHRKPRLAPGRITVPGTAWTWSFWEATLPLDPGPHILAVRATDSAGTTMPAELTETWNVKGYANNAWHRVAIIAA
jgi:hypothetical protein